METDENSPGGELWWNARQHMVPRKNMTFLTFFGQRSKTITRLFRMQNLADRVENEVLESKYRISNVPLGKPVIQGESSALEFI